MTRAASLWLPHPLQTGLEPASLDILSTIYACSLHAAEKKKARDLVEEGTEACHGLRRAIARFELLALEQTEWEEPHIQNESAIVEQ